VEPAAREALVRAASEAAPGKVEPGAKQALVARVVLAVQAAVLAVQAAVRVVPVARLGKAARAAFRAPAAWVVAPVKVRRYDVEGRVGRVPPLPYG
jgi:hypothetical protein